ncbi:MAG TPA: bacteriorhodopsin [Saprospiraceae bacterium]|nr:bacteriorhodopsin [Saprospiraceae bacterium]
MLLATLQQGDYVGFTFFIGSMAMAAATVFFFFQFSLVDKKWKDSLLVSGLITFIAAVHYYYMRDFWASTGQSPTEFRYIDWILTVPLMCVEFYLITKKAGAKIGLLWRLIIASVAMLLFGFLGESTGIYNTPETATMSWVMGLLSGLAYFYILYLVMFGEVKELAAQAGPQVAKAVRILAWFVLVGWAIYPIGYIAGTTGGLFGAQILSGLPMDIVYNIGDAVNKIGFGLVIFSLAVAKD